MESITQGQLKVTGSIKLSNIKEFSLEQKANQHARAILVGTIKTDNYIRTSANMIGKSVTVKADEKVLFCGFVEKSEYFASAKYDEIRMELVSSSILLDHEKKKRSFQNINQNISDVMNTVVSKSTSGDILYNANQQQLVMPLIQYYETDWEFLRRLTSRVYSVIYSDIKVDEPKIYLGMPSEHVDVSFLDTKYSYGFSPKYYERTQSQVEREISNYMYFDVDSYEDINFGSIVNFQNRELRVCNKVARLINSEVIFSYHLGSEDLVTLEQYHNEMFVGMTLLGKVLSTKNETLRLHLDIDENQSESEAYDYEWTPETGNTMYCMPKVGTTISLYFKDICEESAIAVNCIRENGNSCPQLGNVNDRYLTTETNKQMYLKPNSMGLHSGESGMQLSLEDGKAITVACKKEVCIAATKGIHFKAKKIMMSTPSEFQLKR